MPSGHDAFLKVIQQGVKDSRVQGVKCRLIVFEFFTRILEPLKP